MVKAIFFDLGNVLIKEGFAVGILLYEKEHAIESGSLYKSMHDFSYWKDFTLGKISEKDYFSQVVSNFDGELDLKQLREVMLDNFIPNTELVEYIKKLKKKYKTGIISNSPKEWFDYFFHSFGWDNIFDVVVTSGYVHIRKPAKEIFEHALTQAGVSGREAIYVDDRMDRIEGAELLGMKVIIYKETGELISEIGSILTDKK